jgi:hypothetical protein
MHSKFLTTVWALGFTIILWVPLKSDEEPEQSGLFDYTEVEVVGYGPPDFSRIPPNVSCGSSYCFPIPETRTSYKAPQLTATITTTGFAWFLVGVAFWRRGS